MKELDCLFRFDVCEEDGDEVATCGLVRKKLQVVDDRACRVARDACDACVKANASTTHVDDEVFPSILFNACETYLEQNRNEDEDRIARVEQIQSSAEAKIAGTLSSRVPWAACDVFVPCNDASSSTWQAVDSLLNQTDATVIVHLVVIGPSESGVDTRFQDRWNVITHRLDSASSFFGAVHELVPKARTEFIAFQHPGFTSNPQRISDSIELAHRTGADVLGSPLIAAGNLVPAAIPSEVYAHSIPWPTLVIRRSRFIDLGGFADRSTDHDVEFVHRATQAGAKTRLMNEPSMVSSEVWHPPILGSTPSYCPDEFRSYRHHGVGYSNQPVSSDVVVPCYRQMDLVALAIESVIEQDSAEAIVHLIDDCSQEDTHELFRYWGSHPRVRLYRNTTNVGQYVSFNNVSKFFETDLVAVQDGDDMSFSHRLSTSGNMIRLCDSDFFAAGVKTIGDANLIANRFGRSYRESYVPFGNTPSYFANNPSACFRVSAFRRLGGYSDFGGREYNRCGLDSEFMLRAFHSGVRFSISSLLVAQYRVHRQSATMNAETGMGTERRLFVQNEVRRRTEAYSRGAFDPKSFGALGRYADVTQRLT